MKVLTFSLRPGVRRGNLLPVESTLNVQTDFYQYYVYGVGADFDESSVDMAHDGVLAPGTGGIRIGTGTHGGTVNLTVRIQAMPLDLTAQRAGVVASACNLQLPTGVLAICHFAGPVAFQHDFGRPLTCGLLVVVEDRDAAKADNYQSGKQFREHHLMTITPNPIDPPRWRSAAIDDVGASLAQETAHVSAS